jgi:hypothetical protein
MFQKYRSSFAFLLFLCGVPITLTQTQGREPRIVVDLQKQPKKAGLIPAAPFGASCNAAKADSPNPDVGSSPHYNSAPILQLLGAPVRSVRIHRVASRKSQATARQRVLTVLNSDGQAVFTYEPWAEAAFSDIVATIEFSDHTQRPLEISNVHVCFATHAGTTLWTEVFPEK